MNNALPLKLLGSSSSRAPQPWAPLLALALFLLGSQVTVAADSDDYSNWMGELVAEDSEIKDEVLDQTLAEFIFPGSHDAGTYYLPGFACEGCNFGGIVESVQSACANAGVLEEVIGLTCESLVSAPTSLGAYGVFLPWSRAQNLSIEQQLNAGARYFDLRFYRATSDDPDDLLSTDPSVPGTFYIHHTLRGPSSDEIFSQIRAFMDLHPKEIIILRLSQFKEGTGEMSPDALEDFFRNMDSYLGVHMAEKSLSVDGPPQLRQVLASGRRLIVTSSDVSTTPMINSGLFEDVIDDEGNVVEMIPVTAEKLVWPQITSNDFFGLGEDGYPVAADWNNDAKLLAYMREIADRPSQEQMFAMGFQMGVDPFGKIVIRKILCDFDPLNASGDCSNASGNFASLENVSAWTNPKTLPAIIALPRDTVNIVVSDFYSSSFTKEVIKLNRGAVRVQTLISSVSALNNIDSFSAPDFYPIIKDDPTLWGPWGGEYLEITNKATINPNWLMVRSAPTTLENLNIAIEIWDEDSGVDELVDVSPLLRNSRLVRVAIKDCFESESSCPTLADVLTSSGEQGPSDDRAYLVYAVSACEWSTCPDDGRIPVAAPAQSPDANGAGWNNTDVTVSWNWKAGTLGAPLNLSLCSPESTSWTEGLVSLSTYCIDEDSNVGTAEYLVKVDKSVPVSQPEQTPVANDLGWNNADVRVAWNWSDDFSGVAGEDLCAPDSLSSGQGTIALETTCQDIADNEVAESYTVNVDTSDPVITVSQPAAVEYVHSATLTLNYSVSDSVSGIRNITPELDGQSTLAGGDLISGEAIDLLTGLPLGPHTFTVNAVDNADNASTSETVNFTIIATPQSIIDAVNLFETRGEIGRSALRSLLAKLNAAKKKYERGQCRPAGNIYAAFVNQLQAKSGKSITPMAAAILIAYAKYLVSNCSA